MPRRSNGEWVPPHPVARVVHVGRIATGKITENYAPSGRFTAGRDAASECASKVASLTPERWTYVARASADIQRGA